MSYFYSVVLVLLTANAVMTADEPTGPSNSRAAVDALTPIGLDEIKVAGEVGRRLDLIVNKNLLALDAENSFLVPFRQRNQPQGYVGLGKLIDATVRFAAYTKDEKVLALKSISSPKRSRRRSLTATSAPSSRKTASGASMISTKCPTSYWA